MSSTEQETWIESMKVTALLLNQGHHGRDRMVVEFITTYAIGAYHH